MKHINSQMPVEFKTVVSHTGTKSTIEVAQARSDYNITVPYHTHHTKHDFLDLHYFKNYNTNFYTPGDNILWIGSCIAENFVSYFDEQHLTNNMMIRFGHGVNSPRIHELYLRGLFENYVPEPYWDNFSLGQIGLSKRDRGLAKLNLENINGVVLIFGTTEIPYDTASQQDMCCIPPLAFFDEGRHTYRKMGLFETHQSMKAVIELVKTHITDNITIMTAPFDIYQQCSKDIHSGIMSAHEEKCMLHACAQDLAFNDYFPLYEIMRDLFPMFKRKNHIHVEPFVLNVMFKLFSKYYSTAELSDIEKQELINEVSKARNDLVNLVTSTHYVYNGGIE